MTESKLGSAVIVPYVQPRAAGGGRRKPAAAAVGTVAVAAPTTRSARLAKPAVTAPAAVSSVHSSTRASAPKLSAEPVASSVTGRKAAASHASGPALTRGIRRGRNENADPAAAAVAAAKLVAQAAAASAAPEPVPIQPLEPGTAGVGCVSTSAEASVVEESSAHALSTADLEVPASIGDAIRVPLQEIPVSAKPEAGLAALDRSGTWSRLAQPRHPTDVVERRSVIQRRPSISLGPTPVSGRRSDASTASLSRHPVGHSAATAQLVSRSRQDTVVSMPRPSTFFSRPFQPHFSTRLGSDSALGDSGVSSTEEASVYANNLLTVVLASIREATAMQEQGTNAIEVMGAFMTCRAYLPVSAHLILNHSPTSSLPFARLT